jgi:hypothetical protein
MLECEAHSRKLFPQDEPLLQRKHVVLDIAWKIHPVFKFKIGDHPIHDHLKTVGIWSIPDPQHYGEWDSLQKSKWRIWCPKCHEWNRCSKKEHQDYWEKGPGIYPHEEELISKFKNLNPVIKNGAYDHCINHQRHGFIDRKDLCLGLNNSQVGMLRNFDHSEAQSH